MKNMRHVRFVYPQRKGAKCFVCSGLLFLILCFFAVFISAATASAWNPEDYLRKHLKANYPWEEVQIHDFHVQDILPDERPERIFIEKGLPGKTVFSLEFKNNKTLTATAVVKAFDRVVMSRGAFKKGDCLQREDIYETLMDIQRIPRGALKDIDQAIGKQLTRSIITSMTLTAGMVSQTQLVKKGQRVILLVEADNFKITAPGEIKENSSVGRYVKAVNITSKKMVSGLLADENTVKVGL